MPFYQASERGEANGKRVDEKQKATLLLVQYIKSRMENKSMKKPEEK
jgi:hypothetical protein